jgi:hypothetical protein
MENAFKFLPQLPILAFIYIVVLIFVVLDLWAGVRKAKRAGEYTSSFGFRKTIEKLVKYLNLLLVITGVDVLQMMALYHYSTDTPRFPILTLIAAAFIGFIEGKSIFEKAEDKERAKVADAARIVQQVLSNPTLLNIVSQAIEHLKDKDDKTEVEPIILEDNDNNHK